MDQIEYTRTVVPSSMRSPYWKYFGFPSDNGNNILTRQKIVCIICNTAIAYNKNTSNLRTHLMAKHVEIFQKIIKTSSAKLDANQEMLDNSNDNKHVSFSQENNTHSDKTSVHNISPNDVKRRRSNHDEEIKESLQSKNNFLGDFLNINDYTLQTNIHKDNNGQANKIDLEMQSSNYIGFIDTNNSEIVEISETGVVGQVNNDKNEQNFVYGDVVLAEQQDQQQINSMDIMLADMIQTDLLSLNVLENKGFCKYNQQLTGLKIDDDTINRIREIIEKRYIRTKELITSHVDCLSQNSPYSLSIEVHKDNDGHDILNIYFNYLNECQMALNSILYESIFIDNKMINLNEILVGINLKNCSGIVVPSRDDVYDIVLDFTNCQELPLVECLQSTLTRCLEKLFYENKFSEDYKKIIQIMLKYQRSINKPIPRSKCNWSKLNYLEGIFKNINVEQNDVEEWNELKRIFEYIKPLKMAMDIITDEQLPLCTLTRPLIIKLFEEHFKIGNNEESMRIFNMQKILEKELQERAMGQNFLNEATFFDTRFHKDFALHESIFEISHLKIQLLKRFKNVLEVSFINQNHNIKCEENSPDSLINFRKCSSLKSFFKRDISMTSNCESNANLKTNLDLEIEQYQTELSLDLDQSPALWWQQQSSNYKQLSKIAKFYLTIPCCYLPRLCRLKLEERYYKLEQRKNLNHLCSTENKLWYLYYNDDVELT